jgi:hypothetical protein
LAKNAGVHKLFDDVDEYPKILKMAIRNLVCDHQTSLTGQQTVTANLRQLLSFNETVAPAIIARKAGQSEIFQGVLATPAARLKVI